MRIVITLFLYGLLFCDSCFAATQPIHHYTLSNGLQLFVKINNRSPVVISQLWYKVGSSYEPHGLTGISHALEHMMFQGTKRYPPGKFSQLIAAHGGIQNAMTSADYTMYYQELPANELALSFKLEADRMHNLRLNPDRFKQELKVVQEEKRLRIDNNPQALTYIRFNALANINSPYQHPVIGWDHDLQHLTIKKLRNWYQHYYTPNNAILVVVGAVEPQKVYQLAKKYFNKIPPQAIQITHAKTTPNKFGERKLTVKIPAQLPILFLGYNVPVVTTASKNWYPYALTVIAAILDLGESSRFATELIRNQQLAAIADAGYDPFSRLSNIFTIAAIPAPGHTISELKSAIMQQLTKLKTTPVPAAELSRIKSQLIAAKIFSKDSLTTQATEIGRLESVGLSWKLADNLVTELAKVTPKQIQLAAKKFFSNDRLTITVLQPTTDSTGSQNP